MIRLKIWVPIFLIAFSNVSCSNSDDPQAIVCDSEYSLELDVMPIIESQCAISGCHNGTQSPDLRTTMIVISQATAIRSQVKSGRMPKNSKLNSNQIAAIVCWVDQGALDN